MKSNCGMTLIEMIVVVMIIVGLAGILTPVIINEVEKSKSAKATADLRLLSDAFNRYRLDTGRWPENYTPAQVPTATRTVNGFSCFFRDAHNLMGWDGPYVPVDAGNNNIAVISGTDRRGLVDPWGQYYRLYTFRKGDRMGVGGGIAVVSTGPDGQLNSSTTDIASGRATGDDQIYVVARKL
jgi:prepilin-type N-terminal cleavage/methylation domain-containing protein